MTNVSTKRALIALIALVASLSGASAASARQGRLTNRRVRFARGADSATMKGRVSRDSATLYAVGAKAGQTLTVSLDSDAKTRFDLSGPKDASGQSTASGTTEWSGVLPDDGDYKIFVFTDDHANAPYTLTVGVK